VEELHSSEDLVRVVADPMPEVLVGLGLLIVVIMVHGVCMRLINRHFSRHWSRVTVMTPHWRIDMILIVVVASLGATHLFETLIFSAPLVLLHILPSPRDAYYYVLESYTTLGEANVSLPDPWRLLGPIIAMTGLFTFGWTGSVLVAVMTQFNQFDRAQAKVERKDDRKTPLS
jgi:hypothetical protein